MSASPPVAAVIIPDRYKKLQASQANELGSDFGRRKSMSDVRRPTRGIQLKEDTYATLKVLRGDGVEIPLVNAGSRKDEPGTIGGKKMSYSYSNFIIQSVTEERVEKSQVVETFGEAFIFFYGQRPRVITIQGVLMNTFDFNWEAEWWYNYDTYLRGTRCVEQSARVYLTYDDTMVSGYIMSTSSAKNSTERNFVPFVFQLFVTDYTNISSVGNPDPNQRGITPVTRDNLWLYRASIEAPRRFFSSDQGAPRAPGASMSLMDGLTAGALGVMNSAFSIAAKAANLVRMPLSFLDGFIGNTVRVPYGFEGAVAFDETKVRLDISTQLLKPIRYTSEFGSNSDEFVSGMDWANEQYASALNLNLAASLSGTFSSANQVRISNELTKRAREQWEALGLIPPQGVVTDVMTGVLGSLSQWPIGMKMLRTVRGALVKPTAFAAGAVNTAILTAVPIALGVNAAAATAGIANATLGKVDPEAYQALDRSLGAVGAGVTISQLTSVSKTMDMIASGNVNSFKGFASVPTYSVIGGG